MADQATIEQLALQLREAQIHRQPCAPIRETIGIEDIEAAYAIQHLNNQVRIDAGARVVGRKIGLTSKVVQQQLGVDQPDYGNLLSSMEVLNGDSLSVQEILQPKAEGEIALVLGQDLDSDQLSTTDLLSAIDYVLASIEIVGSRIDNWNIKITDTIADNASASHFVLGHRPLPLKDIDLIGCQMTMYKNGAVVSQGSGADCLGSPINATLWLAKTMARLGTPLKKGELILSGSLGPMSTIQAGDHFVAEFSDLGKVSVHFSE